MGASDMWNRQCHRLHLDPISDRRNISDKHTIHACIDQVIWNQSCRLSAWYMANYSWVDLQRPPSNDKQEEMEIRKKHHFRLKLASSVRCTSLFNEQLANLRDMVKTLKTGIIQ